MMANAAAAPLRLPVHGGMAAEKPALGQACRRTPPDVVAEQNVAPALDAVPEPDVVPEPDAVAVQDE